VVMLRGLVPVLERQHKVQVLEEALHAAARLSHRYIPDRQLPDKAVSVLDTACARLALGQSSTPPAIENATRQLDDLAVQERVLTRETAAGADHSERLEEIKTKRASVEASLAVLKERFEKESALVLPAFVTPDWNFATTINSITAISDNLVEIEIGCIEGYLQTVKTDPTFKMKLTIKVIDNGYHFVSFIKTYGEVRF